MPVQRSEMPVPFGNMIDSDLLIVSNRQPYRHEYDENGEIEVDRPGGGLAAGLDSVARELGGTWIAWGDGEADAVACDADGRVAVPPGEECYVLNRVWLDDEDIDGYYEGYANQVLWPICHTATGAISYEPEYWERYRAVNTQFARAVIDALSEDSLVWFQDYHLALSPSIVREAADVTLAHFWHIPWPALDVYRICPQRRELLEGLLANDLVGFHVDRYCDHFLDCVEAFVPDATVFREDRSVQFNGRRVDIDSFPLGVDVQRIRELARGPVEVDRRVRREHNVQGQLVLGVDRLDYSKGIPHRLAALDYLWANRPRLRKSFTYVQRGMPSREGIPEYRALQDEIERRIESINGRFGTSDWQPVVRIREFLPDEELYGLYRAADVLLVTPLRDGMNLVAQEYVAAQLERDGALVLSEFAGGHAYFGDWAVSVNPFDTLQLADAIEQAIDMNALERNRRMRSLGTAVEELDIQGWMASMLAVAAGERAESSRRPSSPSE